MSTDAYGRAELELLEGAGDTVMGTIVAEIDARLHDADRAADRTAHGAPSDASPADVVRAWGPEQWAPILDRAVRAAAITVFRPGANPRRRPNRADRRTPGRRVQRARMGRRKAVGYPVKP